MTANKIDANVFQMASNERGNQDLSMICRLEVIGVTHRTANHE